jgi:allantoate deiminase
LQGLLSDVVSDLTGQSPLLPSGATHDAAAMADLCPTAMLFVRCKNGVSHSPEEFACEADMRLAVDALKDFISRISAKLSGAFS